MSWKALLAVALVASPAVSHAAEGHGDPVAPTLLGLAIVLLAGKLGAELATRVGQAAVLGELVFGVLLGNIDLFGSTAFEWIAHDQVIDALARIGVILLLFSVGLHSTVRQMLSVGWTSLFVGAAGVIVPFGLGWLVAAWLLPDASPFVHAFLGATLTATSVGITARVLADLGQSDSNSARIIIGAAVIDDIIGLVVLAVVTGAIAAADRGGSVSALDIGVTLGLALGFLLVALLAGIWLAPRLFRLASRFQASGVLLTVSLIVCFLVAWAADAIGLATIVGAFAAGLVLEDVHYKDFVDRGENGLEVLLEPLSQFLVPVFFVVMGMRTDLAAFAAPGVLVLALALTAVAIVGKLACIFGVRGASADRVLVAIGMIPRGEVGLIFASIGAGLTLGGVPVVSSHELSAIVVMVMLTTMITPPLLQWRLRSTGIKPTLPST